MQKKSWASGHCDHDQEGKRRGCVQAPQQHLCTRDAPNINSLSESLGKRDPGVILHLQLEPQTVGGKKQL